MLVEQVRAQIAVTGPEVVPVFGPHTLARLREPVMKECRILTAIDGPEEGVVQ